MVVVLLAGCGSGNTEEPQQPLPASIESAVPRTPSVAQDPPPSVEPAGLEADDAPVLVPDLSAPPTPEPDPRQGEVRAGDSLSKILGRAGVDATTAMRVSIALEPVMDPATIRAGQRYEIDLDEGGDLLAFSFHLSPVKIARVEPDDGGIFRARVDEIETAVRTEAIHGTIETSLWAAMTERGHDPALVDVVVETFAWDIDFFTSTRKGDQFRMLVELHEVDGAVVRHGRVLAAQYLGEAAQAQVFWWGNEVDGRHVDETGQGVQRTLLKTPLKYSRISSGFDPARMHPVLHRVKSHHGVDYAAPEGTPVWAAADGTITFRQAKGGAGNMVILRHSGGLETLYMHLSRFRDGQSVGQKIRAKTVIGYVGMTGLATGPHLHFGVKKNGRYVDPQKVESVRGTGVPKAERRAFERKRDAWLQELHIDDEAEASK
jgi:murein DD-endopeptidase MepM/ murein hydrolase activator NlpD